MRSSPKGLVGSGLGDSAIVTIDRETDKLLFEHANLTLQARNWFIWIIRV